MSFFKKLGRGIGNFGKFVGQKVVPKVAPIAAGLIASPIAGGAVATALTAAKRKQSFKDMNSTGSNLVGERPAALLPPKIRDFGLNVAQVRKMGLPTATSIGPRDSMSLPVKVLQKYYPKVASKVGELQREGNAIVERAVSTADSLLGGGGGGNTPFPPTEEDRKNNLIWWIVGGFFALLLGFLGFNYFKKNKKSYG